MFRAGFEKIGTLRAKIGDEGQVVACSAFPASVARSCASVYGPICAVPQANRGFRQDFSRNRRLNWPVAARGAGLKVAGGSLGERCALHLLLDPIWRVIGVHSSGNTATTWALFWGSITTDRGDFENLVHSAL
jgi:hypothetical protein